MAKHNPTTAVIPIINALLLAVMFVPNHRGQCYGITRHQ